MIHNQANVPSCKIPRSKFDLSNRVITTFETDYLMPFVCYDVIPGDTFNLNTSFLLRFNNITHPFMDNMYVDTFFFFVPYRLIWDNWVRLYGQQDNPGDPVDYITPTTTIKGLPAPTAIYGPQTGWIVDQSSKRQITGEEVGEYCYEGSLFNYLGIPLSAHYNYTQIEKTSPDWRPAVRTDTVDNHNFRPGILVPWETLSDQAKQEYFDDFGSLPVKVMNSDKTVNSLRFRAYNLIWNEWFRDENLQDSVDVPKDDGPDDPKIFKLLKRGKRHDYFTSCLPWPQKGPAVLLPLGRQAPVIGNGMTLGLTNGTNNVGLLGRDYGEIEGFVGYSGSYGKNVGQSSSGTLVMNNRTYGVTSDPNKSGLVVDLTQATSATVNQLREAFAVQRLYEKRARGGTRYFESLESLFGVTNPDLRLQRPEYLGGSSKPFQVTQVPQTSAATENSPQGNLSAYSATFGKCGFTHSFGEHGVVIGLMSVRADLTYQQGINRHYFKRTFLDYYTPTLAFLGEQAVLNEEIFAQGDTIEEEGELVDKKVFGYMPRWDEYRYEPSLVTGYMSSCSPESLDNWHLAQEFDNLPKLNDEFIQEKVPVARIKQVEHQPTFMIDIANQCVAARPLPTYSEPGLIDHF